MSQVFVRSITHLKDKPRADHALTMLQKVASLVKPIMRKHGWTLPLLAEFFPTEANLLGLNVNRGQKILVRLRMPYSPDTFLEQADVVQTMLHELTHNVHGPHDEKFYKFLSRLQEEYDELQRSGYAGEGFFTAGKKLGGSRNVPQYQARSKAVDAAEKRRKISQSLADAGGRTLGATERGAKTLSLRELAAKAAEVRMRDDKACGQGAQAEEEADKAAKDSVATEVIDLTLEDEPTVISPSSTAVDSDSDFEIIEEYLAPSKKRKTKQSSSHIPPVPSTSRIPSKAPGRSLKSVLNTSKQDWECSACTLKNLPSAVQCDACLMGRPVEGWACLACGERGQPHIFWTCRSCGTLKASS